MQPYITQEGGKYNCTSATGCFFYRRTERSSFIA